MTEIAAHGMRFEVFAFSEQGPRPENQDAFSIDRFADTAMLALADGMGGEKGGRMAADTSLETLLRAAPFASLEDARRAVRDADRAVAALSESNPELYGGMGCALGVLSLVNGADGPGWVGAHVGDVRILSRSPDGVLRLETRDHTPAFARWEAGEISLDEIPDSAGANRLQRAVGRGGEPDVAWLPARPGWSWLIVSDGIYKAMRLDELATAMEAPTAAAAGEAIRRKVADRGADDNFTAVFVRALGGPAAAIPRPEGVDPMTKSNAPPANGRPGGSVAAALALAALLLAGVALWTALGTSGSAAERSELESLRAEVDSLRASFNRVQDPFGPSAPLEVPGAASPQLPQGR